MNAPKHCTTIKTFSELILFITMKTIGASGHAVMKQLRATLSNFLETEILCIGGAVYLDFKVNSGSFG